MLSSENFKTIKLNFHMLNTLGQKQPSRGVLRKTWSKICSNKVAFIEIVIRHGCSPVHLYICELFSEKKFQRGNQLV